MISDRHPFVVGQHRIVWAKQRADVGRVVQRGIEVGIVADLRGQKELGLALQHQGVFGDLSLIRRRTRRQQRGHCATQRASRVNTAGHQRIECRGGTRGGSLVYLRIVSADHTGGETCRNVENAITDCGAYSRRLLRASTPKDAEREILDWKVCAGHARTWHPTAECRINGWVGIHAMCTW